VQPHLALPPMMHAKTMVIDGVWATVGSTNLDNLSFAFNDELNLIIYDRAIAQQLERAFHEDVQASRRVTYEAWKDPRGGGRSCWRCWRSRFETCCERERRGPTPLRSRANYTRWRPGRTSR
jgi:phosphatidylserine/phosphatidylglycerophosphate/cardiolipin synthase-like enzyme